MLPLNILSMTFSINFRINKIVRIIDSKVFESFGFEAIIRFLTVVIMVVPGLIHFCIIVNNVSADRSGTHSITIFVFHTQNRQKSIVL